MVFQAERVFTHTNNEKHKNLLYKDHRIHKWKHQKYWNNFEKLNRKLLNIDKILKRNVELPNMNFSNRNSKKSTLSKKDQMPVTTQANFKKIYANAIIDPNKYHQSKSSSFEKTKQKKHPNHQLSWKHSNYYFQLINKHQLIEPQKLKI